MDAAARRQLQDDLRRLGDGDRAAASAVYGALWPVCWSFAKKALRHDDDAKDAAQNALVKLFQQAPSFDETRSALGWALALVTWECRTIRKKRSRSREDAVVVVDVAAPVVVDAIDNAAYVAAVVEAFVALDPRDQQTLQRLLDGAPAGDATSRKRRQRAIDRLRALVLGEEHG